MKSLVSTALLSASILSSHALYIPDDRVWHVESKKAPHSLHTLEARADFRQGSCQMGQIMDPDVDQAKDELWPVCITKKVLPCPAGQYPTHATLHLESVCLSDPTETSLNGTLPTNGTAPTSDTTAGGSGLNKDGRKFRNPSNKKMFYFRTAKVGSSNPGAGSTPGPSTKLNQVWELQVDERTTPATKAEMRKVKFQTTEELEKQKKEDQEKVKQVKLRKEKQRIRRSACLALGAMTWIPEKDSNNLSDEEMEGLMEPGEDDLDVPEKDIEDYMVTLTEKLVVTNIQMDTAGPSFTWLTALFKAGRVNKAVGGMVGSTGRIGGAAGRVLAKSGGKTRAERFSMLKNKNGKSSPAPKKSVDAAKNSDTVKSILKDKTFRDCLKIGAKTVAKELLKDAKEEVKREDIPMKMDKVDVGRYVMTIDMNAKETNNYPSPDEFGINAIIMIGDDLTDAQGKDEADMNIQTYPDNYNRPGRIPYEHCMPFERMDNKLTLLQTWGGSCAYYDDKECKNFLFAQTNREDGQLKGKSNDAVSSAWCTFDLDVKRAPNAK